MAKRELVLTYKAVRSWCRTFGLAYAHRLRRRRPRPGDTWYLEAVFLAISGRRHDLRRAVDQDGHMLDLLVQRRRDTAAAKTFFRKLLKGLIYVPRAFITDQLNSDGAAMREMRPGVEHRLYRSRNNRAEYSHPPTRQRERRMRRFKSPGHAQRFLAVDGPMAQHFREQRHLCSAPAYRQEMVPRCQIWREVTGTVIAASGMREGWSSPLYARAGLTMS